MKSFKDLRKTIQEKVSDEYRKCISRRGVCIKSDDKAFLSMQGTKTILLGHKELTDLTDISSDDFFGSVCTDSDLYDVDMLNRWLVPHILMRKV